MLLQQSAVDSDRVLAAAQLDWATLMADDRRLSRDTVTQLIGAALSATGTPWLGLDLGGLAPVSAHGDLGYAAVTAPNLGRSLATLARYGAIRNDAMAWSLQPTGSGAVLCAIERIDWGPARGFVIDAVVAAVLRVVEAALGERPAGLRVDMPLPAPAWAAQYRRLAPVEIRFGQPALAFAADTSTLALPCLGADARAHASACRACDETLSELCERSVAQHVARLLTDAPLGRYPQLAVIATACGLTPRTLMRRLSADGTSFQTLLDQARQTRALWLLGHTRHTIDDIAALLGYSDTSNFSRTVRRWFGVRPNEMRLSTPA